MAAAGTRIALQDLLAALAAAEGQVEAGGLSAEAAIGAVTSLQPLVAALGRPAALAQVEAARQRLERRLGVWSRARFVSAHAEIEQRQGAGDTGAAVQLAERLRERAQAAGDAYPGAAYDRALASLQLGRVLTWAGRAVEALPRLAEAEAGLAGLAEAGDEAAARMLAVVAADRGDALLDLGRLDEAAESHEQGIEINKRTGNRRGAAVGRGQLGTVRLLQGRLQDAMEAHQKARETFEELGERGSVATAWHQIGIVLETAGQWDGAEAAYQRSLRIQVESGNQSSEAASLSQLGTLYGKSSRLEESARLHRQAATLYEELGDPFTQARSLSNLADALRELGHFEDARGAALEAVQLKAPFGHAAEPWKTWNILQGIETQSGNLEAAAAARSRAMELYAAYRRDGGEPQFSTARLIAAAGRALRERGADAARRLIPPPEQFGERLLPVRDALLALAGGSRDPALAEDARLDYADAVELSLLLDSLAAAGPPHWRLVP